MKYQVEVNIPPDYINDHLYLKNKVVKKLKISPNVITSIKIDRRSLDSRKKPVYRVLVTVYVGEEPENTIERINYIKVSSERKVIIVGFGPAGMFAALRLIELGVKPIIIERGKDVQSRRRDIRDLQQEHIVNPDSNYCFGEGGAGTYSDGKLYTRSLKRGNVKKIFNVLVQHGAADDIFINAHPHIGSNILPKIVTSISNTITSCGGEIIFNSKVTDFILKDKKLIGVVVNDNEEFFADAVILATGHSARDIYYLLHKHKIKIEPKPFAIGVRIEHPQSLINEIQYHSKTKNENLPPASYNLSCTVDYRGVYSFCMCPGGIIVPAATAKNEIVINGMSLSRRDSPFANSGLVVSVGEKELKNYDENYPFNGLKLQQENEQLAFRLANYTQAAPAQRVTDFIEGKYSQTLPAASYIPGLTSARLDIELPDFITHRLKIALKVFNKKMKGFFTEEAQIVAPESRTSSPIRIPRNRDSFMHEDIIGLFPTGEGAGYAGGIVSAAIDGDNCANAVVQYLG
ncbi:MAG: FAD-dependent oxidoreductase [Bacteroidetes bacterium]|nr:FAD-dependent oxidoreductase [Bacteroidota bacterium]